MGEGGGPARGAARLLPAERETSLHARLVARDEGALAELVEVATPWLLNVAQAMLQDRDEAEEVVMEAFRTLWQNVSATADGETALMPYLLRVTRHRSLDRLRSRRRRLRKRKAFVREQNAATAAVEPNEAARPGWGVHTRIHSALEALPPEQRAVVRLAYFEGLTQTEIAEELGIPLGTVKTRLRLAFGRLRTALAGLREWVL